MFRILCIFACVAFFIVLAVVCSGEAFGLPNKKVPTMAPTVTPEETNKQINHSHSHRDSNVKIVTTATQWIQSEVQFLRRGKNYISKFHQ